MKISIQGGGKGKGWSNYVTRKYAKLSKEDRSKIVILEGNTKLGDSIIKSSNYKNNSTTLVLSFFGKISNSKAKAVNEDFKKLFMSGFNESEYHYEAVLHQDTSNTHIHIRIPTKNLLTDTQLRLYYHDKHKNFINAIRDYLISKHDLPQPKQEHKPVFSVESKKERLIQQQRAKQGRKPFNFSKKKGRDEAKKYIANYIAELHESGFIEDFEDLKEVIKGLELDIVKIGKDITGDFNYFTVQDSEGKKIRLQGEIYNEQFWEYTREDRTRQIRANRLSRGNDRGAETSLEEAEQRLKRELRKREEEVRKRYEASRIKSREQYAEIISIQDNANSDNKPIFRGNRGSDVNEIANKRATEHDTEKPNSYLQRNNGREAINDTVRATITRRIREREEILTKNRARTNREQKSLYEQFRESRESLYSKARRVMQERGRARANSRRNNQAVGVIVEKVGRIRADREARYRDFGGKFRGIRGIYEEKLGYYHEQSKLFRSKIELVERTIKEIIDEREAPSWTPKM